MLLEDVDFAAIYEDLLKLGKKYVTTTELGWVLSSKSENMQKTEIIRVLLEIGVIKRVIYSPPEYGGYGGYAVSRYPLYPCWVYKLCK